MEEDGCQAAYLDDHAVDAGLAGNPDTGDGSGTMIAIMVGVMIVAVVVIVIFFATGKKK